MKTLTPEEWSNLEELGRRWASLGLDWLQGMLALRGWRTPTARWASILVTDGGKDWICGVGLGATVDGGGHYDGPTEGLIPDFADPLTRLSLLHYVREAWGPDCYCDQDRRQGLYEVWRPAGGVSWERVGHGSTEIDALLLALEAACAGTVGEGASAFSASIEEAKPEVQQEERGR